MKTYLFKILGEREKEVKKKEQSRQFSFPTAHLFWFMWHKKIGGKKPEF